MGANLLAPLGPELSLHMSTPGAANFSRKTPTWFRNRQSWKQSVNMKSLWFNSNVIEPGSSC
eukprot:513670-Amphidinium_carterae.1